MGQRLPLFSLLAALAVAAPLTTLALAPAEAFAQAFTQPLVEMIPGGEVIGDGTNTVELHFVAMLPDGKPMTGLNGKLGGAAAGAKFSEVQPGLYRATWTPPAVEKRKTIEFTLSGKSPAGAIERAWSVTVQPPAPTKVSATASPEKITLGVDSAATVTFKVEGPGGPVTNAELVARASTGSVQNITSLGDGRYVAQFMAPQAPFPQLAIVTVAERSNPDKSLGHIVIPMQGKVDFPLKDTAGATVIMTIGAQEYIGQADGAGNAKIPIVVPPGVGEAKVTSVVNGQRTERMLDLQVPAGKRVVFFPTAAGLPADATLSIPVRVFVARADGQPDESARVAITADKGSVGEAKHEGRGVYMAMFTPPNAAAAGEVSFKAVVADQKGPQEDTLTAKLAPTRPGSISLTMEPPSLDASTTAVQVFAKVKDPAGAASPGRSLSISAAGAAADGPTRDLGNGDYQANFRVSGAGGLEVVAVASVPSNGNPLSRVLVIPLRDTVKTNDDFVSVAIITVDRYGYPVGNVPVELTATTGDGRIPNSVTTDGTGVAVAVYTSGPAAGLGTIRAEAKGHVGTAAVVQSSAVLSLPPLFPSATVTDAAQLSAWRRTMTAARATRGGGAVAAPVTNAGQAGPAARISAAATPAQAAPGAVVAVKVSVLDANGRGATAPAIEVLPMSGGTVSAPVSLGNGEFAVNYTMPANAAGDVKLAISTNGGAIASILSIPVGGAAPVVAWGSGGAQTPPPAEVKAAEVAPTPEPPKEPKVKPPAGEHPWLHAKVGYSGGIYNYFEQSTLEGGPIYDADVNVGNGITDPAKTAGFDAGARVWLPMLENVGFDAGYRLTSWSIQMPEGFSDPVKDGISKFHAKALGRYFYDQGEHRFSAGGGLGIQTSDFLYFQVDRSTDPAVNDTLNYDQLITVGPTVAFEGSYELGRTFYVNIGYEMGFTDFKGLFSDAVGAELGYALNDNLFVTGNVGRFHRATRIYYGDNKDYVGQLNDTLLSFGLGIGYQY